MRSIEITRYTYYLFGSRDTNDAVVFLYDASDTVVAELRFVASTDVLSPTHAERAGRYISYYRRDRLSDVVDLLRNEKPIYFTPHEGECATVASGYEPTGEEESSED